MTLDQQVHKLENRVASLEAALRAQSQINTTLGEMIASVHKALLEAAKR